MNPINNIRGRVLRLIPLDKPDFYLLRPPVGEVFEITSEPSGTILFQTTDGLREGTKPLYLVPTNPGETFSVQIPLYMSNNIVSPQ